MRVPVVDPSATFCFAFSDKMNPGEDFFNIMLLNVDNIDTIIGQKYTVISEQAMISLQRRADERFFRD